MSNLRDIKNRIKSVRNIQQITKAMKMVAAARIRKAEDQLKAARPYAEALKTMVGELTEGMDEVLHPLMEVRPVERVAVVIVSSDKGLCGGYNNNLLKLAWEDVGTQLPDRLVAIGAKVNKYLARRKVDPTVAKMSWEPNFELAEELAELLTDWFVSGEVDQVVCYYTQAASAVNQVAVREVLLPLQTEDVAEVGEGGASKVSFKFEPSADATLEALLPRYVRNSIYKVLMESKVAELGARLKAMTNATDNADKLADELTLQFFRLRQEAITNEILEISGGAEALAASS